LLFCAVLTIGNLRPHVNQAEAPCDINTGRDFFEVTTTAAIFCNKSHFILQVKKQQSKGLLNASSEPDIEAVQYTDWEHQSASNQEAPHGLCKACKDVCEPSKETQEHDKFSHFYAPL
jgi:hypothetical protein